MNTETKVHEHDMKKEKYDIYKKAYNAGKSDAILEFVEMVKKDIGAFVGEDDEFVNDLKKRLYKVLDDRKDEVINK